MNYLKKNPEALVVLSDSYKFTHFKMYLAGTQNIYAYFESRNGAKYDHTVFSGLQFYLKKYLEGSVVDMEMIDAAEKFSDAHFMGNSEFNREMWEYIVNEHGGKLPIRIKAVPEGSVVNISNVMMTVEITDETLKDNGECLLAPLTNFLETILTHVWSVSNVATISRDIKSKMAVLFSKSVDEEDYWMLDYMLHDFGFRGVSSVQSAGMSGSGHLINFKGTDTVAAITYLWESYTIDDVEELPMYGHSVNATEHSVMTQLGPEGEFEVVKHIIKQFPKGVLSVVADSYDINNFVDTICEDKEINDMILARDGKFVVRPDSPRFEGDTAADQIVWIVRKLAIGFGYSVNDKGYMVLNPKVGVIYGDGLSPEEIEEAINALVKAGWAASTCVFGMGGGLLQKHNRDTQRNAFKCSARKVNDVWQDVYKQPKDASKASKKGRMKLMKGTEHASDTLNVVYKTFPEETFGTDQLVTVFENGEITHFQEFEEIRERAKVEIPSNS